MLKRVKMKAFLFMGATAVIHLPAQAQIAPQTEGNDEAAVIVVTGTRAADATTATSTAPISIVGSDALARSSQSSLGAALQTIVPSINFPQSTVASSAGAHLNATLRGLAPDQSLVLFNGQRAHKSAFVNTKPGSSRGTQAVDLTILPVSMMDRVEVLQDAAAAQYGSDAIAGVINVVMRNADEGGSIDARAGIWEDGDGFTTYLRGWKGFKLFGEGKLTLAFDLGQADNTNQNISPEKRAYYFAGDPREATVDKQNMFFRGQPKIALDARTALSAELPLSDSLTYKAFVNYAYKDTFINASALLPNANTNVRSIYPDGSQPRHWVYMRDLTLSSMLHYEGGLFDSVDLSGSYGSNNERYGSKDTVNASLGAASPTRFKTGGLSADQAEVSLDVVKAVKPSFFAGPLTLSAGIAWRYENFSIRAGEPDAYRNGGVPISGGPNDGKPAPFGSFSWQAFTPTDAGSIDRNVYSAYIGAEGKLLDPLRISVSGRAERYSDFGSVVTGQASARLQIAGPLAIRGSISSGVRAPSLGQARFSWIQSTFLTGATNLFQIKTYPVSSPVAIALGATDLKPEKSVNISAGTVFKLGSRGSLTVDGYIVKIKDRIALSDNFTGAAVVALVTAAGESQVVGANFFTNALDTRTEGVSIAGRYAFDLGALGRLSSNVGVDLNRTNATKVKTVNGRQPIGAETLGYLEHGTPRTKVIVGSAWTNGGLRVEGTGIYYGSVSQIYNNAALNQRFGSMVVFNASMGYEFANGIDMSVGADNLFSAKPDPLNTWPNDGGFPSSVLNPIPFDGRFMWAQVRYKF